MWFFLTLALAGTLEVEVVPDTHSGPEARRTVRRPQPLWLPELSPTLDGHRDDSWDQGGHAPFLPYDDGASVPDVDVRWGVTSEALVLWVDALPDKRWSLTASIDPDGLKNVWYEVTLRAGRATWTVCRSPPAEVSTRPLKWSATPCEETTVGTMVHDEGYEVALPWSTVGRALHTLRLGLSVKGPARMGGTWAVNGSRQAFPVAGNTLSPPTPVRPRLPFVIHRADGGVTVRTGKQTSDLWTVEHWQHATLLEAEDIDFSERKAFPFAWVPEATRVVLRERSPHPISLGVIEPIPTPPELRNVTPVVGERMTLAYRTSRPTTMRAVLGEDAAEVELPRGTGLLHVTLPAEGAVDLEVVGVGRFTSVRAADSGE